MYKNILLTIIITSLILSSCLNDEKIYNSSSKVQLKNINGQNRLYVNDKVFYVKGAGLEVGNIENLASHGANSFRTWRTENGKQSAKEVLDEAQKNGLMVLMGIEIGRDRHGFDYNDTTWVKSQFESVQKQVYSLKDHPALLAWAIGNELNLDNDNKKVWIAVNEISEMIHTIDSNHPTTTTFAGFNKENADDYKKYCTDLDFVSIQMYGDIINLQERITTAGYDGPYMITEWGATGHWEMPKTKWGIPIEQTSSEKAKSVKERWHKAIEIDTNNCLGSYIFFWGQKQERTPTWYGLFTEKGNEIAVIDVMHETWTGKKASNQCPAIDSIFLDGKTRFDNISLSVDSKSSLKIIAEDYDLDSLQMRIEILSDIPENYKTGGDKEERPKAIFKTSLIPYQTEFVFKTPSNEGTYRAFVYIIDGNSNAATANIPFYVRVKENIN